MKITPTAAIMADTTPVLFRVTQERIPVRRSCARAWLA